MKNLGSLLIVDDNKDVLSALEVLLEEEFDLLTCISNPNQIPQLLQKSIYDVVLLDMNFTSSVNTGNEGIFWLNKIIEQNQETVVVLFTAFGDVDLAVKVMKEGATDFVMKPWDNDKLLATLKAGVKLSQSRKESKKLRNTNTILEDEVNSKYPKLMGGSDAFNRIREIIVKTAPTDANILLTGENGTGKSLIAHEIHQQSLRAKEAFVTVDLGSLSESLFESELFGYKKGAFTDAKLDRIGRVESANGGTLFLDEIGNLSLAMQSKLLNVLQEKTITPLGSNQQIAVDIRLITATNKNLQQEVANGKFREDLFYRVNTISLEIIPLRDRPKDIKLLSEFFLNKYQVKYNKPKIRFGPDFISALEKHTWPGNVRELEHAIEQSVILAETDILGKNDFHIKSNLAYNQPSITSSTLEEIEKRAIINAVDNNMGNQVKAAKELNITRQTIYNKMKKYGL
ncbi:sigma-54 dependent transcriptional regulator [Desulfosarcina sp.]|nr:sigma-54 dependent transcriptional regulator [Desulfosarcina sp.]